jgi:nucleotide-binding universal stress UspA family protein
MRNNIYRNIMIATDGSELVRKAIETGIEIANKRSKTICRLCHSVWRTFSTLSKRYTMGKINSRILQE